ncbi:hypothetical protein SDC64_00960 [Acinetobacter haemolyticus]|uniref:hypothetical protein n=1 Tax=Acinetobacter haemolyticus TaxID=29430 RepID=UPI002A6B12C4|nr:hypothetical protein [Acinetobacter haemolyticus]WPO67550.1 hypothetical protein SDC64_00960 [Acinetobacter haemolyticus]
MIDIVLEMHWSNNPIPLDQLVTEPDVVFDIPLGLFTSLESPVKTVNGKTGDVVLNADDVGADQAGTAQAVFEALNNQKLDKIDFVQHFRGVFSSYAALTSALPAALDGDYAHIDSGSGFDRMSAIWDSSDTKWIINPANVGSNTDEIPEGSNNLYFTSQRVRQTTLNSLETSSPVPISATDTIIQALGKVQAQLSNASSSIEWVDASEVATFPAYITNLNTQFAKWNGMLVAKLRFSCGQVSFNFPIMTITNNSFKIKGPAARFPIARIGSEQSTSNIRDIDFEIKSNGEQEMFFTTTSASTTNTYRKNWIVIGELLN